MLDRAELAQTATDHLLKDILLFMPQLAVVAVVAH